MDDIREYIARAAVVVMPLRIGAGTKHRILQALAMKKAIVASTVAAEGMNLADGINVRIADDAELFARHVIELMTNARARETLGENGLKLMLEKHSWTRIYRGLDAAFERAVSRRAGVR